MSLHKFLYTVPLRLRSLFRRKRVEAELDEEMGFHIQQRIAHEIQAGRSPEEARAIALRAMEGVEQQKEECRDARHITFFENRLRDLRYALRSCRLAPGFSAAVIVTLALGIGVNTAVFSLADKVMLKLLPVKAPEQLYLVGQKGPRGIATSWSYPDFRAMQSQNTVFNGMASYGLGPEAISVQSGSETEQLAHGIFVSGNYFETLGISALLGRVFNSADDRAPGATPYAVLDYDFWRSRFNSDANIIGRKLRLNMHPVVVVGVGPRGFHGTDVAFRPDFFLPITMRSEVLHQALERWWNSRHDHFLGVIGRLKAGIPIQSAEGQLLAIGKGQDEAERRSLANPQWAETTAPIMLQPAGRGYSYFADQLKKPLLILFVIVALILAIACANVAGLMIAREAARRREIAVRLSIGASRGRVVAQLLTEALLLSLAGGALGIILSILGAHVLLRFIPQPDFAPVTGIRADLDWRVLAFTGAVCLATAVIFGLAPAWLSTRVDVIGSLKDDASRPTGWGRMTPRKLLVVLQVALSIPILFTAGLFVRTMGNLHAVDIGMAEENVFLARVDPSLLGYKGQPLRNFYDILRARIQTSPGVRSVSLASIRPLTGSSWNNSVSVEGYTPKPNEPTVFFDSVGPRYFETLGTPLLLGRDFTERDNPSHAIELPAHLGPGDKIPDGEGHRVLIVNEAFAKHYFGRIDALGGRVALVTGPKASDFYEIVGVVKDARYFNVRDAAPPMAFIPVWRRFVSSRYLLIRSDLSAAQMESALRREIARLDPAVPLLSVQTLAHNVDENILVERMVATLSAFFGALALLLCAVGLYGVVAYTVTRRTREIGIRIAVGSPARSVLWLVMREVIAMIALGTLLGAAAAFLVSQAVRSVLFGVQSNDPLSLIATACLLAAAAVGASFLPARRAVHIDPMRALRYE